jgi:3,4-dihydroxy 2-butanone 4-phosphate synthase/GTP cyclohydrolase II
MRLPSPSISDNAWVAPGDFRNQGAISFDGRLDPRPGHVVPLLARPGRVLRRPGHTEAAIDLAVPAGLRPAGVLCELVNDDGTMMRGEQLAQFGAVHGLTLVAMADLIAYRRR